MVAGWQGDIPATFRAEGVPVFPLEAEAITALAQFVAHDELVAAAKARAMPVWKAHETGGVPKKSRTLNEADSLAMLTSAGLSVVPHRLCRSAQEAASAWRNLGGPVVVKGCSADLPHKSEYGLVRLGLDDEDAIAAAYREMEAAIAKAQARFDGVIVARMSKGRREMMIGAHRDAFFGPVVVVGDGGKYVEAMPDVALLMPPFTREDAVREMQQLRCGPVLGGVRGEPAMDLNAMADAAVRVAALMSTDPSILSLDMNPLMLFDAGKGYAIVDAVVEVAD